MPAQIDTPIWTLSGWLWGIVGFYVAALYLVGWYSIFAAPLILVYMALATLFSLFTESFETSLGMASLIISPLSIWFLVWQLFGFVGPSFIDIFRSVGLFLQRAHSVTPSSAIIMMRQRRLHASQQASNLLDRIPFSFKRERS